MNIQGFPAFAWMSEFVFNFEWFAWIVEWVPFPPLFMSCVGWTFRLLKKREKEKEHAQSLVYCPPIMHISNAFLRLRVPAINFAVAQSQHRDYHQLPNFYFGKTVMLNPFNLHSKCVILVSLVAKNSKKPSYLVASFTVLNKIFAEHRSSTMHKKEINKKINMIHFSF